MRHARAAERLSEYLDGSLPPHAWKQVDAHLAGCAECRRALAELRQTTALLRGLRGAEDAPDLSVAILERIRAGEADPSALERLRAAAARFLSGAWGAPLATAAVGLAVLAVVPRIEIEVSIPGGPRAEPMAQAPSQAAAVARAPLPARAEPGAQAPHAARPPALASRRVRESRIPSLLPAPGRPPAAALPCWEQPSFEACQKEPRFFMDLALRDTRAFLESFDAIPAPDRERWIRDLSRFAAEAGSARSVAEQLRASDDPRAWQMATHFESATFDRR